MTQLPKGFGFCEFADPESAHGAIRTLDKREFRGRILRVDYQDQELSGQSASGARILTPQVHQ
jgi:cleavage stimulation factor subunit 2